MHVSVYVLVLQNCEWLITTVIVPLTVIQSWIPMVILELIHMYRPNFTEGLYLLDTEPIRATDIG